MDKFNKEWRARWWLWTAVLFAIVVFGGLIVFRGSLYTPNTGMPLLAGVGVVSCSSSSCVHPVCFCSSPFTHQATPLEHTRLWLNTVTENAQELCDAKCADEVGVDTEGKPSNKDKYEACLALCVKGETEQVAEERQEFAEEQAKEAEEEKAAEEAAAVPEVVDAKDVATADKINKESAKLEAAAEAEAGVRRMLRLLL